MDALLDAGRERFVEDTSVPLRPPPARVPACDGGGPFDAGPACCRPPSPPATVLTAPACVRNTDCCVPSLGGSLCCGSPENGPLFAGGINCRAFGSGDSHCVDCAPGTCPAGASCTRHSDCAPGNHCDGGACAPCGSAWGQPCCVTDGNAPATCTEGLLCRGGTCQLCGMDHLPCCDDALSSDGLGCADRFWCSTVPDVTGRPTCRNCGIDNARCCEADPPCLTTSLLARPESDGCWCRPCGASGQPCCAGGLCAPNTHCDDTRVCRPGTQGAICGMAGQPCCPGHVCLAGTACRGETCQSCGRRGSVCCPGGLCPDGSYCTRENVCGDPPCGSEGQLCCAGGACNGMPDLHCNLNGYCEAPCGLERQTCCQDANQCMPGLRCSVNPAMPRAFSCERACGNDGAPCCNNPPACVTGLQCQAGRRCGLCGGDGQACCSANQCDGALQCNLRTGQCAPCGGQGQQCCAAGSACQDPLQCDTRNGNVCQPCGALGQQCCNNGRRCPDPHNACNADTSQCEPCGGAGQVCCVVDPPCTQTNLTCAEGRCTFG